MDEKNLTEKQRTFLDALFNEAGGDVREAMNIAGYSAHSTQASILAPLADYIVERSKVLIAAHTAKATLKAMGILDDPNSLGAERIISLWREVSDRSGIVKKDKVEVTGDATGIFILPAKRTD